jgi:hypothetical protein
MICVKLGADIRVRWWVHVLAFLPLPWPKRAADWVATHGIDIRPYTVREDGTKDYM